MTTALAEREPNAPAVTTDQLELIKRTVATGATADELKLYLYDCARQGVHPLDKLIHFTKRKGKYTPITSIDFMRTRAADTGEYAGSDDAHFTASLVSDAPFPEAATVTVWRLVQGQRCPFTATARWAEYYPGDGDVGFMWRKMPHTMLAKCSEALALRKGFPRQLAGLYAREEMDQADSLPSRGVSPDPPETVLDARTGETVPVENRPPAPEGYAYIHSCELKPTGWYEVRFLNKGGKGTTKYSTQLKHIGEVALQLYQNGFPVRIEKSVGKHRGEFYIDKIEAWRPEPTDAELDREIAAQELAKQASEIA